MMKYLWTLNLEGTECECKQDNKISDYNLTWKNSFNINEIYKKKLYLIQHQQQI